MLPGLLLTYRQKTDFPYNKQKTLSSRLRSLKQFIVHDFIWTAHTVEILQRKYKRAALQELSRETALAFYVVRAQEQHYI